MDQNNNDENMSDAPSAEQNVSRPWDEPPPPEDTVFSWHIIRAHLYSQHEYYTSTHPIRDETEAIPIDTEPNPDPRSQFESTAQFLLENHLSVKAGEVFDDIIYLAKLRELSEACDKQRNMAVYMLKSADLKHPNGYGGYGEEDTLLRRDFFEMLGENLQMFIQGQERIVEKLWTQSDWKKEHDVMTGLGMLNMGGGNGRVKEREGQDDGMEGVEKGDMDMGGTGRR